MTNNHLLKLLINASRSASRKLYRDFCEIENLQGNRGKNDHFVKSSIDRVREVIATELSQYKITSNFTFSPNEDIEHDIYIRILPLDSPSVFKRARTVFGMLLILYQQGDPTMFVINFPALKQILYGSTEDGISLESLSRNIVEQINKKGSAKIVAQVDNVYAALYDIKALKDLENLVINHNTEIINSPLYLIYLLSTGKMDLVILPDNVFYRDIANILINIPDLNISSKVDKGALLMFNTAVKI